MSQTSEKNVSQLATKVRNTGNFGRAKERHTLTHRFLPRKRCDTTTEKKKSYTTTLFPGLHPCTIIFATVRIGAPNLKVIIFRFQEGIGERQQYGQTSL